MRIKVTPKSASNKVSVAAGVVKVHVTAPPAGGEANRATLEALSKALQIPKSSIEIASGGTSRNKTIRIGGMTQEQLDRLIKEKIE